MSTIYEVAKRAGVSTATVSRVLSRPAVVSPDTRQRVMQAVELLGFTPNSAAKSLRTLRTGIILVTVPDIANPFFALVLQGIEDAAHRQGYSVLLGDTQHDAMREERYAVLLKRKAADGLIFLGHRLPKVAATLLRTEDGRTTPIVNGCEFSPSLGVPSVHIDNERASFEAMEHLYDLGHRRIGIVTGPLVSPLSRDRLNGAMTRARLTSPPDRSLIIEGDFSIESGVAAGDQLLDRPDRPSALFCFNDEMAIGVLQKARERGLRVPDDLSVVGFDDIRFARFIGPPLTTITQPMREIGEGCVRLLLEVLRGDALDPVSVTLPHKLTIRASTAPPRQLPA